MHPATLVRKCYAFVSISLAHLTSEQREFVLTWRRGQITNTAHALIPIVIVAFALSLPPIAILCPPAQRWQMFATHVFLLVMTSIWQVAQKRIGDRSGTFFLITEIGFGVGYAFTLHAGAGSYDSLSDILYSPVIYAAVSILVTALNPSIGIAGAAVALLQYLLGIWAFTPLPGFKMLDWCLIFGVIMTMGWAFYFGRVNSMVKEAVGEFAARQLALQNERLRSEAILRELALAKEIQDSFTPSTTLAAGTLHASFFQQKFDALGGDWMAARQLGDGSLAVVVADATGKGIQAALVIHAVQSLWVSALETELFDPALWIELVNKTLCTLGRRTPHTMTLGLAVIWPDRMSYFSAGHIPAFLMCGGEHDGETLIPVMARGNILGLQRELAVQACHADLSQLSVRSILLGSDGVFDRGARTRAKTVAKLLVAVAEGGDEALASCPVDDDKLLVWVRRAA